jgi:uncharacterized small protein (DUF1192 family)
MAGNELKLWSVSYYGMPIEALRAEIARLDAMEGTLDQRARAEIRKEQCQRMLEEYDRK